MKKLSLYMIYFFIIFTTHNIVASEKGKPATPSPVEIPVHPITFAALPTLQRVKSQTNLSLPAIQAKALRRSRSYVTASPKHQYSQSPYKSPLARMHKYQDHYDSE